MTGDEKRYITDKLKHARGTLHEAWMRSDLDSDIEREIETISKQLALLQRQVFRTVATD